MHIPTIPPVACDPGHAEIIILCLVTAIGFLIKAWLSEKRKNGIETATWRSRIEGKLDQTISNHDVCQKSLPYNFVTKDEFKGLQEERNKQWTSFLDRFERLMTRFWKHNHDNNGKVDAQ